MISPETQHAYNLGMIVLLVIFVGSLFLMGFLLFWMRRYKYERDIAYNVLISRFGSIENISKEITVFDLKYNKNTDVSYPSKEFDKLQVKVVFEIENAIIDLKN